MKHIKSTRSITVTQKMTGYLIECDTCGEQYTDSTKKKRLGLRQITTRAVNQSNQFVNKGVVSKCALTQKRFHEHNCSDRYSGIEGWFITLIVTADTLKEFRRKELHWIYNIKTYVPYGLNKSNVYKLLKIQNRLLFFIYNNVARGSLIRNILYFYEIFSCFSGSYCCCCWLFLFFFSLFSSCYYLFKTNNYIITIIIVIIITIIMIIIITIIIVPMMINITVMVNLEKSTEGEFKARDLSSYLSH